MRGAVESFAQGRPALPRATGPGSRKRLRAVAEEIGARDLPLDVTDPKSVDRFCAEVLARDQPGATTVHRR
jgi:hypothetical protein